MNLNQNISCNRYLRYAICLPVWLILSLSIGTSKGFCQNQEREREQVEKELERAIEEMDPEESEVDIHETIEYLEELHSQLIDINHAGLENLIEIPGLSIRIATNIINHRSEKGSFYSFDELLDVSGVGPVTLEKIRPYITLGDDIDHPFKQFLNPATWIDGGRFENINRYKQVLQIQEGYSREDTLGGYLGSQINLYQRVRYTSNHLSTNITLSKSPGEPFNNPLDLGSESWHFTFSDIGTVKSIVIGDYSVSFGQGLLLGPGGAFGKGRDVTRGASKNERGIRPKSSTGSSTGFRGFAMTVGERIQLSGFFSSRKRTSTAVDETTVNFPTSTARRRTINELGRVNNLGQMTYGGRIRAKTPIGFIGMTAYQNRFDKYILRGSQPYQHFNFEGQELSGFSTDINFLLGNIHLISEFAYLNNGGYGLLSGLNIELGSSSTLVLSYRNYEKTFQSIFGSGFGEQSGYPRNENGFYMAISHQATNRIKLSGYMDHFQFPSPRFQTKQSTSGYDWLGLIEYELSQKLNLHLLIRSKIREQEFSGTDQFKRETRFLGLHKRSNMRFQLEYWPNQKIRLRTRVDLVQVVNPESGKHSGTLLYQDIRFYPHTKIRLDIRLTIFDTDDYESRLYQFENDLLYVMSNTMLYDRGQRAYLLLQFRVAEWLDIWFKIASTLYENRQQIGSGMDQIIGNRRSDIGIQSRIKF
ncbi:MAG: helix-hairpin-helix domain-containing protein [Balneolaceae bacterium]